VLFGPSLLSLPRLHALTLACNPRCVHSLLHALPLSFAISTASLHARCLFALPLACIPLFPPSLALVGAWVPGVRVRTHFLLGIYKKRRSEGFARAGTNSHFALISLSPLILASIIPPFSFVASKRSEGLLDCGL
jgi:uncharacterized paraquat-inducible protein A